VQNAQVGPCAAHDGLCVASVVRSVLISIESDFPALGVRGGEAGDDDEVLVSVSTAVMILERRICVCERGIRDALRARPPKATRKN